MAAWDQIILASGDAEFLGTSVEAMVAGIDRAITFLRESPWTPTAAAGLALGVGLVLWFAGARIARPAMVAACAIVGAVAVGSVAETWNAEPLWLWMIAGVVVGAVAGLIIFRLAVAGVIALALGLAAPAGAAIVQNIDLVPDRPPSLHTGEALFLDGVARDGEHAGAIASGNAEAMTDAVVARARAFASAVADEASAAWSALSDRDRLVLAGSAIGGALLGLGIGLFWPGASAAAVTSALGAAIWLPAAYALIRRSTHVPEWLPHGGMSPLGLWIGVTLAGTMIQTALMTRRRARAKVVHVVQRQDQPAAA
ncbi:MAG: hypothetical protein IBJ10_06525 [Phycisphaerales bacterium]|nr:hypothetical protein [Phycisphaerales bacterium]